MHTVRHTTTHMLLNQQFYTTPSQPKQTCNNLSVQGKLKLLLFLLEHCVGREVLARGAIQKAAEKFHVGRHVVSNIWKLRKHIIIEEAESLLGVFGNKKNLCGKKPRTIDPDRVKAIEQEKRETVRSLGHQLGVAKSTVQDHLKNGWLQSFTNTVKPVLTETHKLDRMEYCIDQLEVNAETNTAKFNEDYATIHVDEKWFFLRKIRRRVLGVPGEQIEPRHTGSKRFISKVMFLSACSRPIINQETGEVEF